LTKDVALKLALAVLKSNDTWGSSIRESKDKAIAAIKEALAQPAQEPNDDVTDEENEQFSRNVSNFKGADPEATKYAICQFLRGRKPAAQQTEPQNIPQNIPQITQEHSSNESAYQRGYLDGMAKRPQPLTDEQAQKLCRIGRVYAPDGRVIRTPQAYRKELKSAAMMGLRNGEAAHDIKGAA